MPKSFAATLAALAVICALPAPSLAAGPAPGQRPLDWCYLNGGEPIEQPPGSPITMCCVANEGCVMCNADGGDCVYDPPYRVQGGSSNRTDTLDGLQSSPRLTPQFQVTPPQQQRLQ